jgi:hypothetical protein
VALRAVLLGRNRRGLALRLLALVAASTLLLGYAVWPRPSGFERAVRLLPGDVQRVLWTDWQAVRAEVDCDDWQRCESDLADTDLGAASALIGDAEALEEQLGWGPRTIGWELLGQGTRGQVLVVGGLEGDRIDALAADYEDRGFTPPAEDRVDGGVWEGGADLLASLGIGESVFGNVAFLAGEGLLLSSDDPGHLADAVEAAAGGDGLDFGEAAAVATPLTAVGLVGDRACEELSFAEADPGAQAEAEQLVKAAGGVQPLDGYLVALGADGAWTAVLGFEDDGAAEDDLLPRQRLAAGADPGQMTDYHDLFTLESAATDGRSVVLRGRAVDAAYALSQTTQGPVLLASC